MTHKPLAGVIAGTHSGCGKTSVSLALMAAFARKGLAVQPFKAGPDFIDPGLHAAATGRSSHNLDGWMLGRDRCRALFSRESTGADLALVEGVMGLHDGAGGDDECGSTAEMAKWLGLPVLLVVDARSMARSAAALVQGYLRFDPELAVAGVLFNRVGSARHRELLEEAMLASCPQTPVLGYLPREEELTLPQRHLGLHTADEGTLTRERLDALVGWIEASADLARILDALPQAVEFPEDDAVQLQPVSGGRRPRIGVARDRAFCFYYQENFRILQECGAELVFFSPLDDAQLPPDLDGLYLGGGYPEVHAWGLSGNVSMRRSVQGFALRSRPVYGECGGFMYLMDEIVTEQGPFPMAGVFAMQCRMDPRLRSLGYREIVTRVPSLFGPAWTMLRGHEYHYSSIVQNDPEAQTVYRLMHRKGWLPEPEGHVRRATLGSYVHVHFGSNPEAAAAFVASCAACSGESNAT